MRTRVAVGLAFIVSCAAFLTSCQETTSEVPAASFAQLPNAAEVAVAAAREDGYTGGVGAVVIDATGTYTAGDLTTTNAWSTIKVPIVLAALKEDPDLEDSDLVEATLRWSDNDTSWTLWKQLGSTAAEREAKVEAVLRAAGDTQTTVDVTTGEQYGITQWSLRNQATLASNLRCLDNSGPVLDYMGDVIEEQHWGVGTIDGALFKGGWGPDDEGAYQARQMALIPVKSGGDVTVVLATNVESEEYREDAEDALTRAAESLKPYLKTAQGRDCALNFNP
ncbi:hypothetical protein [Corynebacterium pyruviciproducens]|uniref:Serine hydrolase n=1 Tax=Corynebacterium pyruviciproducens TaxID=598660 RepID=A0AAF0YR95_9CORY|nr:hypothetical protein [Corynebacterium pyruviciproducens]WOT02682.1 hypothetical protein CYJ47_02590 [Corynebacterium pyruviciproducens]